MASDYLKRQIYKQKYGGGTEERDFNLTRDEQLELDSYKPYYPNEQISDKAFNSIGSGSVSAELDTRTILIILGSICVAGGLAFVISQIADFVENSALRRLQGSEWIVLLVAFLGVIVSLVLFLQIIFFGYLIKKSERRYYSANFIAMVTLAFLISVAIVGFFFWWSSSIVN